MIPLFEQARLCKLSEMELQILDYLEANLPSSVYASLDDLSLQLYTSNATIVRLCQKIGMKGFNDFKYQIRAELKQQHHQSLTNDDFIQHSLALFKDNIALFDVAKLEEIAHLLTSNRFIYIYGSNLSSIAAKYLQTVLNTLDYPCILIEWQRLLTSLAYDISSDAVLFIITAHGDAKRYQSVFEMANKQEAVTILLTCEENSPLIPLSTISLCTNDQNEEYRHVDVNPRLGILTIVQILIELAARIKENNAPSDLN